MDVKQEQVEFHRLCFTVEILEKNEDKLNSHNHQNWSKQTQKITQKNLQIDVSMLSRWMLEDVKARTADLLNFQRTLTINGRFSSYAT